MQRIALPPEDRVVVTLDSESEGKSGGKNNQTSEQDVFKKIIAELRPASLLNIESDPSYYPKLASSSGSKVVVFDSRPEYINRLYLDARADELPILPLKMDFTKPTPAYGLSNHHFLAATERFQCEMVVAPRLIRYLQCEDRRLSREQIVEGLALFSTRWVLLGFTPLRGYTISDKLWDRSFFDSLESFARTAEQRFRTVDIVPFYPATGALLVCEK